MATTQRPGATESNSEEGPTDAMGLDDARSMMEKIEEASQRAGDFRPSISMVRIQHDPAPPARLDVSCSADEIRRDAMSSVEALSGLRLAARREVVHGRWIAENQHVAAGYFEAAWRLSDDLKARGTRLGGGRTMTLVNLPREVTQEWEREARETYYDLYACLARIDGPQFEDPLSGEAGKFPSIDDALLSKFADVSRRLGVLAGTIDSGGSAAGRLRHDG